MNLTVYSEKVLTIDSQDHTASDIFPGISQGITYIYNAVFGLTLVLSCTASFLTQTDCLEWFLCQSGGLKPKKLKNTTFYCIFFFCQYYQYDTVFLQGTLWSSVSQKNSLFWGGVCYGFTQLATYGPTLGSHWKMWTQSEGFQFLCC